ncbi:hypothetical protein ACFGVR_12625 [Mucilaginibacter sp. AW1-3]
MKNPFVKQNNGAVAISIALGSVAAGAAAYLFLTERGTGIRGQLAEQFGRLSNLFSKSEPADEHPATYLEKPHKTPKTDRNELLHHKAIQEQPNITN